MFKEIKNILILALFIVIVILLFQVGCNKPEPEIVAPAPDSVIVSDTVWATDTTYLLPTVKKPEWDTVYKIDTLEYAGDPEDLFFTREYNDSLSDTNQTVFYHARTFGMLDSLAISYKLKIPIKITNTTTITNTNIVTKIPKFSIYTGLEVGGNTSTFSLSPIITLNIKNNSLSYRYGVLDKTHNIGVGIKLFKSKK
jgi:hypothetical protein